MKHEIHIVLNVFPIFKERASTEPITTTADYNDAPTGGAQKKKRGLGSFFKATEDTAQGPSPPQQDHVIVFELQGHLTLRLTHLSVEKHQKHSTDGSPNWLGNTCASLPQVLHQSGEFAQVEMLSPAFVHH